MTGNNLKNSIVRICKDSGFSLVKFSKPEILKSEKSYLENWIKDKKNATMKWMENNIEKRVNPFLVMNDVKSIISLALLYDTPVLHSDDSNLPRISRYAWGKRDYHKIIKSKLKQICKDIELLSPEIKTKFYVDDGPMMDKVWAVRSGIGWMGKNTNVINPDLGSYFFLSEILINMELEYDEPIEDMCKNCRLCLVECPTGALYDEYKLDANLCISYQTIENRGEIPDDLNLNGWIFGCDICQEVCPYNSKGVFTDENLFFPREELTNKSFDDLLNYTEKDFNETFSGTPVKRTKYTGWIRNLKKAKSEINKN
ncbi:MAG TPA: tRNA epoxyqueuosine(34) reductase QueG [Bacteroidetes bacterium]|nr:tRNA epoxyqueuosine(34) reductase QueG [Bacteroidota bacterium]HCN36792.1 tRNA epoxyqueuosine(34) reductase QueG [Bacteroidota bacterium]